MARELYGILQDMSDTFEFCGFIGNCNEPSFLPGPLLGQDDILEELFKNGIGHACLAVGDLSIRKELFLRVKRIGFAFPPIIHPKSTFVGKGHYIEEGTVLYQQSLLMNDITIGKCCIINSGCILTHDVEIGDFVNLNPRSVVGGCTKIGSNTFIGLGTSIRDSIKIGTSVTIGMGSVVTKDVKNDSLVMGVPAN